MPLISAPAPAAAAAAHGVVEQGGAITASSTATTVTGGADNTKGAYVQLIASTAEKYTRLAVVARNNATNVHHLFDIATGAAGSEVVLIPNIYVRRVDTVPDLQIIASVSIPAGTRISARCQGSIEGSILNMQVILSG